MDWSWRGKYYPAGRAEYESIRAQFESERVKTGQFSSPCCLLLLMKDSVDGVACVVCVAQSLPTIAR